MRTTAAKLYGGADLKTIAVSDIGKHRELNEDSVFKCDESLGILPNFYMVADGIGGHRAGDYASQFCILKLVEELKKDKSKTIIGSMFSSILAMNEKMYRESEKKPELHGMGTTLCCVTVSEKTALCANVGDSRMYVYSCDGSLKQISVDHSLVNNLIMTGKLTKKEAAMSPKKNAITRAIGVEQSVSPDFYEVDIEKGDIILLCSDGLTNMVSESLIRDCLGSRIRTLEDKAFWLIYRANLNGGKDNISVVLIEI